MRREFNLAGLDQSPTALHASDLVRLEQGTDTASQLFDDTAFAFLHFRDIDIDLAGRYPMFCKLIMRTMYQFS